MKVDEVTLHFASRTAYQPPRVFLSLRILNPQAISFLDYII